MPTLEEAMLMAEGGSEENSYIVINNDLRTITPPTSTLLLGVYNDKEVLKVPFKMPRYYDDIDLSRFSIQINYINAMRIPNFDEADDIVVEDDHITFNWTTKRSVFLKDGTVQFSVCLRLSDIEGNVTKEFNTTIGYGIVLEGIEADADSEDPEAYSIIAHMIQIKNYVDGKSDAVAEAIDTAIDTITAKQSRVEELVEEASEAIDETRSMVSYPNVAETAAAMSDQTKIYVYTGSETGYNTGHWYYYKSGSGWTDGGLYMSQGVNTDTTLTFPDTPADSKATGIALSKKADYDGSYRELTSGDTYQIMSKKKLTDTEPYTFRKTGGNLTGIGNRVYDEIVGGTVCWNQLYDTGYVTNLTINGIAFTVQADGSILVSGTATGSAYYAIAKEFYALNHVLFFAGCPDGGSKDTYRIYLDGHGSDSYDVGNGTVFKQTVDKKRVFIYVARGTTVESKVFKPQIFDLTQMFGSTIADYIYDLEQNSEGAGVAYFRKYFPNDYYAYNPGELMSVSKLISHETVGFNQWDEEWEVGSLDTTNGNPSGATNSIRFKNYMPVFEGRTYFLFIGADVVLNPWMYDANKHYISRYGGYIQNKTFTIPQGCHYIKIAFPSKYGTVYNHDICINLSDPDKNGTYEPYVKHSYPLDSTLTLRGIPKLDDANDLYYDGDTYTPDGTVTRKYGVVDLGSQLWTYNSNYSYFSVTFSTMKAGTLWLKCAKYATGSMNGQANISDKQITTGTGNSVLVIKDSSYTDAAAFKEAMSGVMLVYELATPTIESAEPYQNPQVVDGGGTEEYMTNNQVKIPIGHNSSYGLDLGGKLETIVDTPSADGTYTLKVTVTNGVPVFSWS